MKKRLEMIKKRIARLPWALAEHAFAMILALVVLSIASAVLFYVFQVVSPSRPIPEATLPPPLRKDLFADILREWIRREEVIQGKEGQGARNIFLPVLGEED